MDISFATEMAEWMVDAIKPACHRIEIAGGIRRGKQDVHDIEIVAVPYLKPPVASFGDKVIDATMLDRSLRWMAEARQIRLVKNGPKYKQIEVLDCPGLTGNDPPNPFLVDLFLVTPPAEWGVLFTIRTGPQERDNNFSQWMVTNRARGGALPDDFRVDEGAVWAVTERQHILKAPIPMPEEEDFFRFCDVPFASPNMRRSAWKHALP